MKNSLGLQLESEQRNFSNFRWGGKFYRKRACEGFTLVELIVVIVILAILAAILVPGLLGWIDKAKEKRYELEARSIYQAAEAESTKLYAKNYRKNQMSVIFDNGNNEQEFDNIKKLAGIESIEHVTIMYKTAVDNGLLRYWTPEKVYIVYTSSDGERLLAMWGYSSINDMQTSFLIDDASDIKGTEGGWRFTTKAGFLSTI